MGSSKNKTVDVSLLTTEQIVAITTIIKEFEKANRK